MKRLRTVEGAMTEPAPDRDPHFLEMAETLPARLAAREAAGDQRADPAIPWRKLS